jgi:L-seryl-tRNA(Ser) seleniumtransferase
MRRHQLLRALRVDKMTLAAFEATLRMYLAGRQGDIPVIRMIEAGTDELHKKARRLCAALKKVAAGTEAGNAISVIETQDITGGGAFPTDLLKGYGAAINPAALGGAEKLSGAFRTARFPVIPGIRDDNVVLHVRTLLEGDEKKIAASFAQILGKAES